MLVYTKRKFRTKLLRSTIRNGTTKVGFIILIMWITTTNISTDPCTMGPFAKATTPFLNEWKDEFAFSSQTTVHRFGKDTFLAMSIRHTCLYRRITTPKCQALPIVPSLAWRVGDPFTSSNIHLEYIKTVTENRDGENTNFFFTILYWV